MKVLYGVGFQEEDRRGFVPMIYNNVITSMKTLVENMHLLGFEVEDSEALSEFEDGKHFRVCSLRAASVAPC